MDIIRRQVAAAQRRLMLQRFGRIVTWSLFSLLLIAAISAAVPKITAISVPSNVWTLSWAIGAIVTALVIAAIATWLTRPSLTDTAAELDLRFHLNERLSSSLELSSEDRDSEMGQALIADAQRRAEGISVAERFGLQVRRSGLLPLLPLVFLGVLIFIPDATRENVADASVDKAAQQEIKQVKTAAEQLKKRLEQRRRQATAEGLKEAEELFKKLERQADKLSRRNDMTKKDALIALNDIKKQLEERRQKLGSPDEMRKALSNLKDIEKGPGDKVAKAMEQGDFDKAQQEVDKLAEKLRDGSLTDAEKEQLKNQMQQMQEQIKAATEQHEQAKQKLQEQIEAAKQAGRNEDAARLQQKMNAMQQMDGKMQQMKEMAEGMQAAQQAMEQGDPQAAADELQKIADQMGQMQQEMEQLEELEDALNQLSQAKDQMGCKECGGQGCKACQGQQNGQDSDKPGNGMGKGQGEGDRPEEESDTNSYDSQVRGQPRNGRAVLAGRAGGENKKGVTRQSVQDAVLQATTDESDPLEDQAYPKKVREHAEEYFNLLRDGKQ